MYDDIENYENYLLLIFYNLIIYCNAHEEEYVEQKREIKMMMKLMKEINNAFNNSGNKLLLIIWFSYWKITDFRY